MIFHIAMEGILNLWINQYKLSNPKNEATLPLSRDIRLDWIDCGRGIAILGVVLVHSSHWAVDPNLDAALAAIIDGGRLGVQLFFLISGFTTAMTLAQHWSRHGHSLASNLAWLVRRFFRIAPLYYLAIPVYFLAMWAATHVGAQPKHYPVSWYLANLSFLHAWIPGAINSVVPGGWSIGVEMNFYVIAPLLIAWLGTTRQFGRNAFALMLIGIAVTLLAWAWQPQTDEFETFRYFWLPSQIACFLGGIFLFRHRKVTAQRMGGAAILWSIVGAGVVLAAVLGHVGGAAVAFVQLAATAGFGALLVLMRDVRPALLVNECLSWIGRHSYSIYIVHFAIVRLVVVVLNHFVHIPITMPYARIALIFGFSVMISALVAILSYRLIEVPFIAFGRRLSNKMVARAAHKG